MLNSTTLYDLDIVCPPQKDKQSLWKLINHCRTEGGREQLRDILSLKGHSMQLTQQRTDAVEYLSMRANRISLQITENEIYHLQHYLSCNYSIDETKTQIGLTVKSYLTLVTAKSDYLYILSAVRQALQIIERIKQTYEHLYSGNAPFLIKDLLNTISTCLLQLPSKDNKHIVNGEPTPNALYKIDRQLRLDNRKELERLLSAYYKLEALCSMAVAHHKLALRFPEFGNKLQITQLTHPLVKNCTPNDICLSGEHIMLITGPNMAGKSTVLKSIGLAFIMAYAGMGVAADYAQLPFYDAIATSINTEDDIGNGYSYFFSEVLRVKEIAELIANKPKTLVITDELFKGTNIKDAGDCTEMVINGFLNQKHGLFIISTHLVETVQLYTGNNHTRLLCFEGTIAGNKVEFDYKIRNGISETRLGKYIMQQENIAEILGITPSN